MRNLRLKANVASVIAVALASAAHSQASSAGGDAAPAATAPANSDDAKAIGDIVVTAQKRSESLQRVPAAASVVTASKLVTLGVTNINQVANLASGLNVTTTRTQAFIYLRGVGQTLTSPNADSAVATNLNGVYLPAEIAGTAFFDVDRIEILPGPQGTLYGRNSTGGVININSRQPGSTLGVDGFFEIGNYARRQAVVGVDIPLADNLYSRTAGTIVRHDGYFNNGLDDDRTAAVRETLVWRPGSQTKITAVGSYNHGGGLGNILQNIPFAECGARCTNFDPRALGYFNRSNAVEASLTVEQELSQGLTLTYVGGYNHLDLHVKNSIFTGPPVAPLFLDERINGQSHELRLNAQLGRFQGILGAYYFDQKTFYQNDVRPTAAQHTVNPFNGTSNGEAIFGQGTYSLTDALRLTGGLRYSRTEKGINGFNSSLNPTTNVRTLYQPYQGNSTLNRLDWKVGVEFDVAPNSLVYANTSTGFTPGGFSTAPVSLTSAQAAAFQPVTLRGYVAGTKNRFADGAITLNLEGFYYDYKNYQVSARDVITAQNIVFNAAKATVYGAQADLRFRPTRHDELTTSITRLHAKADVLRTSAGTFDGFDLPQSPHWTLNAFYEHSFDVGNGSQIRASANFKYVTSRWALYTHAVGYDVGSNTHTDLNAGYYAPNDRWSVQLFVRNLENSLVKASCGNVVGGVAGCNWEPPRTYGVHIAFKL